MAAKYRPLLSGDEITLLISLIEECNESLEPGNKLIAHSLHQKLSLFMTKINLGLKEPAKVVTDSKKSQQTYKSAVSGAAYAKYIKLLEGYSFTEIRDGKHMTLDELAEAVNERSKRKESMGMDEMNFYFNNLGASL